MIDLSSAARTRLTTAFGTVVYIDAESGKLSHGAFESSPANAFLVADQSATTGYRRGCLVHDSDGSCQPIVYGTDGRISVMAGGHSGSSSPKPLELISLERGLVAFRASGLFLSAFPDGRVMLSAPRCSTWELFLASEDWCTNVALTGSENIDEIATTNFDTKGIRDYLVHPRIRTLANTKSNRGKVLIYGYTKWSHGRVYYDLCKQLHRRGYIVDVLDWTIGHDHYISDLIAYYNFFLVALDGVHLLAERYGVPYERIIALSHSENDLQVLVKQKGVGVFDKFANYGVVSPFLYCSSLRLGVKRTPVVATLGVNYADFYADIPKRLEKVGYASSYSDSPFGLDLKRGDLAEATAREAGLGFEVAGSIGRQMSMHDMPAFYRNVDALLMTSVSEGAGLPVLEAAAAGRLVIGTPVGHFPLKAEQGGGIIAPIEAEKFKKFTVATLKYYKENPTAFAEKCRSIQEAARKFDWEYSIGEWAELIDSAMSHRGRIGCDTAETVAPEQRVRPLNRDHRSTLATTSISSVAQPNSGSSEHCRVIQAATKRILFFTGTTWAFGSVHSELVRYLHSRGVVGDVLDWSKGYKPQEMAMMAEYYDYIYGIPGESWPLTDSYRIPHNKIVVVAHGDYDLWHAKETRPLDEFDRFAEYAVISDYLRQLSIDMGIRRIPKVVRYGVNYQRFFAPVSKSLKVVGYGGSMHRDDNGGVDWKRGALAKEAAEAVGLAFSPAAQLGQFHFLAMPRYYTQVDAVLVSSSREGYGLPAMEAAAAGRLVISTPVGGFPHQAALGAGISAPADASQFKQFVIERLEYYKDRPAEYIAMCQHIQEAARYLDWDHVIDDWIALFPH